MKEGSLIQYKKELHGLWVHAATKILYRTCLQGHAIRRETFSQFYINSWKNIAAFLLAKTRWQLNNGTCWYYLARLSLAFCDTGLIQFSYK